jgi:hypothetical protein
MIASLATRKANASGIHRIQQSAVQVEDRGFWQLNAPSKTSIRAAKPERSASAGMLSWMVIVKQYGQAIPNIRVARCDLEYSFLQITGQVGPELKDRPTSSNFVLALLMA